MLSKFLQSPQSLQENLQTKQTVLITGMTGQDGLYMTARLYSQYEVHGIVRKNSNGLSLLQDNFPSAVLHFGDTTDSLFINQLI